jgi:hypothetical protein
MADFWKFFPTPIGSVTDDRGNKYGYSEQSGLGYFGRDAKDWLILKAGETSTGIISFSPESRSATPGSVFSLVADLRLVTKNGEQQQVSAPALSFSNIRTKGR